MEQDTQKPRAKIAAQLMVGPEQLRHFGEARILSCLDYALDALEPEELILSIGESSRDLADKIVERCGRKGTRVSLWVMVFADRPVGLPSTSFVQDAGGNEGYGSVGAWENIGKGDEKFLFRCPSALGDDEQGIGFAIRSAKVIGAQGIFLDRIRYPSPANGLEFLGACSCPRCKKAYSAWSGEQWPDLTAIAVKHAARGTEGAGQFIQEAGQALQFRSHMVSRAVAQYAQAAHAEGLSIGLDLFAPSLASFVGQDYHSLSLSADFLKPMLYCKAFAPAGMPLEFQLLMRGLEQSGVEASKARDFIAGLSGIRADLLDLVRRGEGFPAALAASEMLRCLRETGSGSPHKPEIYAGIELVEHEAYDTKIDAETRDAYLQNLSGQNIAVCWNILYVPRRHIDAIAASRKDLR
ncbi:MAG: hypothetical protein NT061_02690 [Spirochaetes bacterium]|nr:hypothetical protein [Spirochaetota bacterium]